MRLWYDGSEVDIVAEPCSECMVAPNDQDARRAIAEFHRVANLRCAVCGDTLRVSRMKLLHELCCGRPNAEGWFVMVDILEPRAYGEVCLPPGGVEGPSFQAHIGCISKALPHAGWPTMFGFLEKEVR